MGTSQFPYLIFTCSLILVWSGSHSGSPPCMASQTFSSEEQGGISDELRARIHEARLPGSILLTDTSPYWLSWLDWSDASQQHWDLITECQQITVRVRSGPWERTFYLQQDTTTRGRAIWDQSSSYIKFRFNTMDIVSCDLIWFYIELNATVNIKGKPSQTDLNMRHYSAFLLDSSKINILNVNTKHKQKYFYAGSPWWEWRTRTPRRRWTNGKI